MLLFSAMLGIRDTLTKDEFIKLVIEWNRKSPHHECVIPDARWTGSHNVKFGNDDLWLNIQEYRNGNIIAVRYEKREGDGAVWDTDYVMNFTTMKLAIRLERSYTQDALNADQKFSSPYFIALLIRRGLVKDDGDLPVAETPTMITEANADLIIDVINGKRHFRLPVIYVTKTYYGEDPVDIYNLSRKLKGVAHVLALESNHVNDRIIKYKCDFRNEFNGAIGIYYPHDAWEHKKFFYRAPGGYDHVLTDLVVRHVLEYSNNQLFEPLSTWQGVINSLLNDRLAAKREETVAAMEEAKKTREESNSFLADYEKDLAERDELLATVNDLTQRIISLEKENAALRAKNSRQKTPLLYEGEEQEFYTDEIKDMVLDTLSDALESGSIPKGSRRRDVLTDIVESNHFEHIVEGRAKELKRILNGYDGMDNATRNALEKFGFEIVSDNRHFKARFFGDKRYACVFSATPSDYRTGKNQVRDMKKILF